MKIYLGDFTAFKYFIEALKVVNEEQTLTVTEDGISAATMDPSHVAMIMAKMKKTESFKLEDFSEEKKEITLALNVSELMKVLDRIDKVETVELNYNEETARFLVKATRAGQDRRFSLPVMEPMIEELPTPKIKFTNNARITSEALNQALKDASLMSEHVKLEGQGEEMSVKAAGDTGDFHVKWDKISDKLLKFKSTENATSTYTLSYLSSIVGTAKKEAEVFEISWTEDMPIEIKVECNKVGIELMYYLAPCIG